MRAGFLFWRRWRESCWKRPSTCQASFARRRPGWKRRCGTSMAVREHIYVEPSFGHLHGSDNFLLQLIKHTCLACQELAAGHFSLRAVAEGADSCKGSCLSFNNFPASSSSQTVALSFSWNWNLLLPNSKVVIPCPPATIASASKHLGELVVVMEPVAQCALAWLNQAAWCQPLLGCGEKVWFGR